MWQLSVLYKLGHCVQVVFVGGCALAGELFCW